MHLNFKIYKHHIVNTIYIINYTVIVLFKCIYHTILNKLTIKIISISFIIKYYFIAIICTFIFFILLRCLPSTRTLNRGEQPAIHKKIAMNSDKLILYRIFTPIIII